MGKSFFATEGATSPFCWFKLLPKGARAFYGKTALLTALTHELVVSLCLLQRIGANKLKV